MYEVGAPKEFTATGSIDDSGTAVVLKGVVLTGGSDAASAVLRKDGASGTIVLTMKAAAGVTVAVPLCMSIQKPHVTLTGTGPTFTANL
jgi:hypothetical protein